jgi:hypothetical protein
MSRKLHIFIFSLFFLLFIFSSISFSQDKCQDFLLLDGAEPLLEYGLDTTDHWWAVTQPFKNMKRMIIDGEEFDASFALTRPKFSPNGADWAFFSEDAQGWMLITNDTIIDLNAESVGEIAYSPNGEHFAYTYFISDYEMLVLPRNNRVEILDRSLGLFLSNDGNSYAFKILRSGKWTININGEEGEIFDEVIPVGFWWTGEFIFAGRNSFLWNLYQGDAEISESYDGIYDLKLNKNENVLCYVGKQISGLSSVVIISDEFQEPLETNRFDRVFNLILHPTAPLVAFNAEFGPHKSVNLNFTEYAAEEYNSQVYFTHDGENLFFLGCRITCFASIDGHKFPLGRSYNLSRTFAIKPGSKSFAYSTSSSLVVRYTQEELSRSGMMCDQISDPRFNWRRDRYEAIGEIYNRLYLLTCKE